MVSSNPTASFPWTQTTPSAPSTFPIKLGPTVLRELKRKLQADGHDSEAIIAAAKKKRRQQKGTGEGAVKSKKSSTDGLGTGEFYSIKSNRDLSVPGAIQALPPPSAASQPSQTTVTLSLPPKQTYSSILHPSRNTDGVLIFDPNSKSFRMEMVRGGTMAFKPDRDATWVEHKKVGEEERKTKLMMLKKKQLQQQKEQQPQPNGQLRLKPKGSVKGKGVMTQQQKTPINTNGAAPDIERTKLRTRVDELRESDLSYKPFPNLPLSRSQQPPPKPTITSSSPTVTSSVNHFQPTSSGPPSRQRAVALLSTSTPSPTARPRAAVTDVSVNEALPTVKKSLPPPITRVQTLSLPGSSAPAKKAMVPDKPMASADGNTPKRRVSGSGKSRAIPKAGDVEEFDFVLSQFVNEESATAGGDLPSTEGQLKEEGVIVQQGQGTEDDKDEETRLTPEDEEMARELDLELSGMDDDEQEEIQQPQEQEEGEDGEDGDIEWDNVGEQEQEQDQEQGDADFEAAFNQAMDQEYEDQDAEGEPDEEIEGQETDGGGIAGRGGLPTPLTTHGGSVSQSPLLGGTETIPQGDPNVDEQEQEEEIQEEGADAEGEDEDLDFEDVMEGQETQQDYQEEQGGEEEDDGIEWDEVEGEAMSESLQPEMEGEAMSGSLQPEDDGEAPEDVIYEEEEGQEQEPSNEEDLAADLDAEMDGWSDDEEQDPEVTRPEEQLDADDLFGGEDDDDAETYPEEENEEPAAAPVPTAAAKSKARKKSSPTKRNTKSKPSAKGKASAQSSSLGSPVFSHSDFAFGTPISRPSSSASIPHPSSAPEPSPAPGGGDGGSGGNGGSSNPNLPPPRFANNPNFSTRQWSLSQHVDQLKGTPLIEREREKNEKMVKRQRNFKKT